MDHGAAGQAASAQLQGDAPALAAETPGSGRASDTCRDSWSGTGSDIDSERAAGSGPGINSPSSSASRASGDKHDDSLKLDHDLASDSSTTQTDTRIASTSKSSSILTAPASRDPPDPATAIAPPSPPVEPGPEPRSAASPGLGPASAASSPASASPSPSPGSSPDVLSESEATPGSAVSEPFTTPTPGLKPRPPPISPLPPFVAPASYLFHHHFGVMADAPPDTKPLSPLDKDQRQGLKAIREFLRKRTSYDVLPLSFRLIVLDTDLLIKKSLNILIQNSIVSAPLWDSHISRFAGILTATDYINVIQYHCQFPDEMSKLDQFRLASLPDIEKAIGATPIETVSVHPSKPLYEALRRMLKTRARRIPLVDLDEETGRETVISVITQYRILKFIAVNNEHNTILLKKTVRDLQLGTYTDLAVARMGTTVLEVINLMVSRNISCVPIVDSENRVLNAFEAVDIIPCIKGGAYDELNGSVGEALCKRPEDNPGIFTCSEDDRLDSIFDTIRKSRVHRLVVVDDENKLKGVISLSDILKYVLLHGEEDDAA
ncbi:nuclear protein SNF4 [Trichoderma gracile]